jgi:hypothetical protein
VVSVGKWFAELLILAASYGALLTTLAIFDVHHDATGTKLLEYVTGIPLIFLAVACTAFMNFVASGYILTSWITRTLCAWKAPRLYLLLSPCLVVVHIELLVLLDRGWQLTVSQPLFLAWGAATATCTAYFGMRKTWQAA